jgi:hypothetical protein
MKITIENTTEIVEVNRVPARVWEGTTESGIKIQCLITLIAALKTEDCSQFERELQEQKPPTVAERAFPMRMLL